MIRPKREVQRHPRSIDTVRNVRSTLNESSRRRLAGRVDRVDRRKAQGIAMPHKVLVGPSSRVRPHVPEALAPHAFDARAFLESTGVGKRVVMFARGDVVFSQGDPGESVMFIRRGAVQLSVLSRAGREAIVGTLGPGDFLGEGALAGHPVRLSTARATTASTVLIVPKRQMIRLLHSHPAFSDRFIAHVLARNARLEADLVDQLFNTSEKRLARTLLLLARYGRNDKLGWVLPKISQAALADMVGTTRSRVNFFMNKFKKLGFVEYNGGLTIRPTLVTVMAHPSSSTG
jgi:CRP-like cAMP-binding protein